MTMHVEVAIIGGGQAGLAMSALLNGAGIDHVVIERGRIGERWRSERWPSLRLLTPNWMTRLPGLGRSHADPDGFMTSAAFVALLEDYARHTQAPVWNNTAVLSVEGAPGRYRITTTAGEFTVRAVVIATGACDRPSRPDWASTLHPDIAQLTPDLYRSPTELPPGGVLIVGASATGAQLAREIRRAGREVALSAGRHVRAPRRYRGLDLFRWLDASGFLNDPVPRDVRMVRLRSQPSLQLMGHYTDGSVGLPDLAAEGVRIVGRSVGASGSILHLDDTLIDECMAAEARRRKLLSRIDTHIEGSGIDAPEDAAAWAHPALLPRSPLRLDLEAQGIRTVLWATGYLRAYPWLKLPIIGRDGELLSAAGRTPLAGVFTLGLQYQRHRASAFIDGVGRDAEAILPAISNHLAGAIRRAA